MEQAAFIVQAAGDSVRHVALVCAIMAHRIPPDPAKLLVALMPAARRNGVDALRPTAAGLEPEP